MYLAKAKAPAAATIPGRGEISVPGSSSPFAEKTPLQPEGDRIISFRVSSTAFLSRA
jgi:hypothetical protein